MSAPNLTLIPGGGDMVDAVDDLMQRIISGEIVGIVLCGITEAGGGSCGWTWAHREGIAVPWPRLVAAVSAAQNELLTEGLNP